MKSLYVKFALLCALCSLLAPQLGAMEGKEGSSIVSETRAEREGFAGLTTVVVTILTNFVKYGDIQETVTVPYKTKDGQKVVNYNQVEKALKSLGYRGDWKWTLPGKFFKSDWVDVEDFNSGDLSWEVKVSRAWEDIPFASKYDLSEYK